jgi:replicative DNA helicase
MFIHRENNEDGIKGNLTEILIEKHRNGPTGRVTLNFDDKRASFQEIDSNSFEDFSAIQNSEEMDEF